jgi:hypothetical protein
MNNRDICQSYALLSPEHSKLHKVRELEAMPLLGRLKACLFACGFATCSFWLAIARFRQFGFLLGRLVGRILIVGQNISNNILNFKILNGSN